MMTSAWLALALSLTPTGAMAEGDEASAEASADAAEQAQPGGVAEGATSEDGAEGAAGWEALCNDGVDNDGDFVTDCADADCFQDPACAEDNQPENTDQRCSDWIDNDGDGHIDCDDTDCDREGLTACTGSWTGPLEPGAAPASVIPTSGVATSGALPEMKEGMTVEDLIGSVGDKDGERNDYLCSDGIDNDGDGAIDCADYGCRFDTSVTVCQPSPGMRFSVVAGIGGGWQKDTEYEIDADSGETQLLGPDPEQAELMTNFEFLQLRALGPIPLIQDSFFLISSRAEKDFRITFAMFQIPVLGGRHQLNVNSGGGGLSQAAVISQSKQLLLSQPYYLYNAFDQGNGAAIELSGPLVGKRLNYRTYAAGGTGRWGGSVGGQYVGEGYNNYTWSAGGQVGLNIFGLYSRFDNPFLYTPVPLNWGLAVGAKYDQRNDERYDALNLATTFRKRRLILSGEAYGKHELNYDFYGLAYNFTAGFLVWPKKLMVAADFGEYMLLGLTPELIDAASNSTTTDSTDTATDYDVRRERSERQWRAAAHYYFYRNIGVLSLVYTDNTRQTRVGEDRYLHHQELALTAQYRF